MDPVAGSAINGVNLNKYLYAKNNPVNFIDHGGLVSEWDGEITSSVGQSNEEATAILRQLGVAHSDFKPVKDSPAGGGISSPAGDVLVGGMVTAVDIAVDRSTKAADISLKGLQSITNHGMIYS